MVTIKGRIYDGDMVTIKGRIYDGDMVTIKVVYMDRVLRYSIW
jgi:hypothetical protein